MALLRPKTEDQRPKIRILGPKRNRELFREAKKYIPGGVNSPVRAFRAVGGYPVFVKEAHGSRFYGECGGEFIDYCMSWGSLILGHSHSKVIEALQKAIKKGTSFGTATKLEIELTKSIVDAIPSIELVRLTNSGTEATMSAVRLALAYTGKGKVVKFEGSYHGAGIPEDIVSETVVVPYNDLNGVEKNAQNCAAIIVEPVAGNMGVVLPKPGFLQGLREICDKHNIVLIFDEVITGFRLCYGGAQNLFDIKPDLTCLGKIIGGGLPIGAFGGRREIMELVAPLGKFYQAGTLSGNPIAVTAGLTTLKILTDENPYKSLEINTRRLCEGIKDRVKVKINFIGSMFTVFFEKEEIFRRFYHELLKRGIYFSPSPREANFLSTAHTEDDIEETINTIKEVGDEYTDIVKR